MRKLTKENVNHAFKTTNSKELLVTSDGHIFKNDGAGKSFCKRYCTTSGASSEVVKKGEVDEFFEKRAEGSAPKKETEPSKDVVQDTKIASIEDFLKVASKKKSQEVKDFAKSLDSRMPEAGSKAEAIEQIEAALKVLKERSSEEEE